MRRLSFFLTFLFMVVLPGCGPSDPAKPTAADRPTEADAKAAFERSIAKSSSDLIRLKSFAKTNGADVMGMYSLKFEAELEVLTDCLIDDRGWASPIPARGIDPHDFGGNKAYKKGDIVKLSSKMLWVKTEKGWQSDKE